MGVGLLKTRDEEPPAGRDPLLPPPPLPPLFVWRFDGEPPGLFIGALIARRAVYSGDASVLTKEVSRCVERNKDIVLRTRQICSWSGSFVQLSALLKTVLKDRGDFLGFLEIVYLIIYLLALSFHLFLRGGGRGGE